MVENWPWLRKLMLLLIAGLVMLIAVTLASWILIATGLMVYPAFSVWSGFVAFLTSLPFLWTARPRERRHLVILSTGVFVATMATLLATTLLTYRLSPDTINFVQQKALGALSLIAAMGAWGLVYFLVRGEGIWGNQSRHHEEE